MVDRIAAQRFHDSGVEDGKWSTEMLGLIDGLRSWKPPPAPFPFRNATTVHDGDGFRAALLCDVAAGPDGPRGRAGVLLDDLRWLARAFWYNSGNSAADAPAGTSKTNDRR